MRRKEREVKDIARLDEMIRECQVARLGLCDGDYPYVVPLNFGYTFEGETLVVYFHSALEGRKLDLIRANPNACVEFDRMFSIIAGENACSHSTILESVIGFGRAELVEDGAEKVKGLNLLMLHHTGKGDNDFSNCIGATAVIKVTLTEFAGKTNRKKED